ncbi:MAG: hypothetical protein E7C49_15180 [Clostridium sp.]|nr:hypothetical protein [Clostridium sp.]
MKKWTNPELTNLSVNETNEDFIYDCMTRPAGEQKGPHRHCPVCGESSSSCNHIDWTPIEPALS